VITTTRRRGRPSPRRSNSRHFARVSSFQNRYPDLAIEGSLPEGQEVSTTTDALTEDSVPAWKRAFDVLLIFLFLPILLVIAALVSCWIQAVSPGNVLFRQTRVGRNGKPFTIYKFRSMELEAPTDVHEAHVEHLVKSNKPMTKLDLVGDSRLIKGGCLIRSSGIDELPQLINVLRGEMSLVGPRPCLPKEFDLYEKHQRNRFAVQPGLTGQWQVSRTDLTTFSEMVEMDDDYVEHLSLLKDLRIILQTPIALFGQMKGCSKSAKVSKRRQASVRSSLPVAQAFSLPMGVTQKLPD
jgi:exopolysaccharide production protein ExoY